MTILCVYMALLLRPQIRKVMVENNLIAVENAKVHESYADILEHGIRPIWLQETGEMDGFANAPPGSTKRRIWETALAVGVDQSIRSINSIDSWQYMWQTIVRQSTAVGLFDRVLGELLVQIYCIHDQTSKRIRPYIWVDPDEEEYLRVIIGSEAASYSIQRTLRRTVSHIFEMDSFFSGLNRQITSKAADGEPWVISGVCTSGKLSHNDEWRWKRREDVTLQHMEDLITGCGVMLSVCVIVLLIEWTSRKCVKNRVSPSC